MKALAIITLAIALAIACGGSVVEVFKHSHSTPVAINPPPPLPCSGEVIYLNKDFICWEGDDGWTWDE